MASEGKRGVVVETEDSRIRRWRIRNIITWLGVIPVIVWAVLNFVLPSLPRWLVIIAVPSILWNLYFAHVTWRDYKADRGD